MTNNNNKEFKMILNKIYDNRNFGQLDAGYPFTVWVHCTEDNGAEYQGWYYIDKNWAKFKLPNGRTLGDARSSVGRYYFHQSKLSNGKECQRKVSVKINKEIIKLINKNKHTVRNYTKTWNNCK
tara:strand:- start:353 stop:724 length:372 start_codon:yes stop_codon:yes gene_type:complete